MPHKISVALCTYNGALHIEEQLATILNQSIVPDEIVICDDRSSDETVSIIKKFIAGTSVEIRLYQNEKTLRVKKNFEKAISLCQADIIFLSDQDDVWEFQKVETVVNYFDAHPRKTMIFTNGYLMNGDVKTRETIWDIVGLTGNLKTEYQSPLPLLQHLLLKRNLATGATMAFRSSIVKTHLPFAGFKSFLHDYLLAVQAASNSSLGFIDECLIYYRIHPGQHIGFRQRPGYLKPIFAVLRFFKRLLISGRIKAERNAVITHLKSFTVPEYPEVATFLDNQLKK